MYKNTKFSQMKGKKLAMKNSNKVNKTGLNSSDGYRSASNHGRINKSFDNRQFNLQDVTKLKQLCTATNEWIQQKSSELLDVLRRSENKSGDNCHRTVTLQSGISKMGYRPPNTFDSSYNDNDFQQCSNQSEIQHFDRIHVKSNPATMHYKQNREHCNQEESDWSFEPTNMPVNMNSYQSRPNSHLFSIIDKLKMYVTDKPFSAYNATKLFVEAVHATGTSYTLQYVQTDKKKQHRFNLIVENLVLGIGKSFVKKRARLEAYINALNRLNGSSIAELCDDDSSDKPESNKLSYQAIIEPDHARPISTLVIRETQKTATRREKHAMSILRRSVYFSKMNMNKLTSVVGNVHKITILVQNKPVGIGFGSSVTKASVNAAADALFNNFYRRNPVIQALDEDDSNKWIPWNKIKYLAEEMERIGGHSLIAGKNISNRSFATAIKKLVDTHPWNEVNHEMIFGPGISEDCIKTLYSIAKERNLNFEERRHHRFGTYYIIQRYYDPIDIVTYLEKNGGCKGKYRLLPKAEIPQIQCDHWEPKSQVWNRDKIPQEILKSKGSSPKSHKVPRFPRMEEHNRNVDNCSKPVGRSFNNDTFSMSNNKQKIIDDDQVFSQMSNYKEREFNITPHPKEKFSSNNDGRFDQTFTQEKGIGSFNDTGFRQISRSDNEFRQLSNSCDHEPKQQLPWPCDREYGQMPQAGDREYRQMPQAGDSEYGQMPQAGDREYGQMPQAGNRKYGQMPQAGDRKYGQMPQVGDREYGQMSQVGDREYGQMPQADNRKYGQMPQAGDREYGQMPQVGDREYGQMPQVGDREYGQMPQAGDREYGQMPQAGNREYGGDREYEQMPQQNSEEFGQRPWFDNREFEQMCRPDEVDFGQMSQPDDREFKQMYLSNNKDHNQMTWHDQREYKETFWSHDKDLNRMPNSRDREFKESPRFNAREFRRMHNLDEHELHGVMERGMSDNFDREYRHDKNQTRTQDERRFNPMYQDFNQTSGSNEREFNAQFHCNEKEREQVLHSYDENYKQMSDFNKERFSQNPPENKVNKLSGQSDIGFYHSSNYDKRFNKNFDFDKQVSDSNNRQHNQMLFQNKREYNLVSCDDNRPCAQLPKYDDRRLRFNNDQLSFKDHHNQMNQGDLIDTNRMQSNITWNKMQDLRSDRIIASNSVMYCPSAQMPGEPLQGNMMMQNIMNINQAANKDQLCALRFLTKKIAHTALHANVNSILANAQRLSNIAKARRRKENSASNKALLNPNKHGKGIGTNKFNKHTVPDNQLKPATILKISQNSKVIKKATEKQSALNKNTNKSVSSQNKNTKKRFSQSNPKSGNTTKKLN